MGLNNYNDSEDKFSETLKALKELPKVNAPDDFEFNLMIKITNGELNSEEEEKRQSKWIWILAPAAFVVTSVILFVTLTRSDIDRQLNPLQNQGSIYAGKTGDTSMKGKGNSGIIPKTAQKRGSQTQTSLPSQDQQYLADRNAPPLPEYYYNPLSNERSFKLDNLLKGGSGNRLNRNQTVDDANKLPDEFFQNEGNLQKSLKDKKAVKDSLRKMVSRNDSLKMKKNIKR
jgi:hypothetical protein